jgi:hypothetical protein
MGRKNKKNQRYETILDLLNKEYGFPDSKAATFKKVKQYYDEKKAQHIFYFEFAISRGEKSVALNPSNQRVQSLIHQLMDIRNKT